MKRSIFFIVLTNSLLSLWHCGIQNKEPETIFKAFDRRWVEQGPGIPKDGIFSDNGGEFKNPVMKEAAAKYGIKLSLTAGNSP